MFTLDLHPQLHLHALCILLSPRHNPEILEQSKTEIAPAYVISRKITGIRYGVTGGTQVTEEQSPLSFPLPHQNLRFHSSSLFPSYTLPLSYCSHGLRISFLRLFGSCAFQTLCFSFSSFCFPLVSGPRPVLPPPCPAPRRIVIGVACNHPCLER